ncbi:hypothetical protein [Pectobacterium versatile]|uniref:hypothetical protein n=1 Tax=Pectobacterium versatile TaxID=2488639 RepID=UPI001F30BF64|nr:hypothetical protein [Pectobacterium versatile]GKV79963.1 hypothetical protein PEC106664_07370 [Pectobacterium carotovorum subsp. carotovorum]GKW34270.1 hypothetical protein PEC730217_30500 [Pectobacterium carotovorum subsp. carotovorum]
MSKNIEIKESTYHEYGFKRQELTDFFYKKGKTVNFGVPPMNFISEDGEKTDITNIGEALDEIERLKQEILELKSRLPGQICMYRDDDPLLLAIEIRNDYWADYDPENDRPTRGSQEAIITELKGKGFTTRQAESIELVACPIKR